jgi:hypothetical protein
MSVENDWELSQPESSTPDDFPRAHLGAVAGAQAKILAVKVGDKYVQSMSESEAFARYSTCFDLVNQLQTYCNRKLTENAGWTPGELLRKLRIGIARRLDWGCTPAEQKWILKQLCIRMNWRGLSNEATAQEFTSLCTSLTFKNQKDIDNLLGLKYDSDGKLAPLEKTVETVVDQVRKRLGT